MGGSSRPISSLPPEAAASQLADAGITMDELAKIQDKLVRSASQKQQPMPASTSSPASSPPNGSTVASRLEKARERARMLAERQSSLKRSPSAAESVAPVIDESAIALGTDDFEIPPFTQTISAPVSQPSSSGPIPSLPPTGSHTSFKSEVMYDVTSSHRPTSPPPVRAASPSNGLPSLRDLSASTFRPLSPAFEADRQSKSLAQALEEVALRQSTSSPTFQQSSDQRSGSLSSPTQSSFPAFGSTSQALPILEEPADFGAEEEDTPQSPAQRNMFGPSADLSPQTPQTASYSDPGRHHEYDSQPQDMSTSVSMQHMSPRLIDDVAAQARAATRALKGPEENAPHSVPRRSKTLGRRKSSRKLSKAISNPQLISTSQRLDHTITIRRPDTSMDTRDDSGRIKSPAWGRSKGAKDGMCLLTWHGRFEKVYR